MAFESVETLSPKGPIRLEPSVQVHERLGTQSIHAALGVSSNLDQADVAQDLEMARHPGLMHVDLGDQVGHRTFPLTHGVEDPSTRRIGYRIENFEPNRHRANIRPGIYMVKQMYLPR